MKNEQTTNDIEIGFLVRVITWVLKVVVTLVALLFWFVFGFLIWVPYWLRMTVWLSILTVLSVFKTINTENAQKALQKAINFWPSNFSTIIHSVWRPKTHEEDTDVDFANFVSVILSVLSFVFWAVLVWGTLFTALQFRFSKEPVAEAQQGVLTYEDKVNKWLVEINKAVKRGDIEHNRFWGAVGELRELNALGHIEEDPLQNMLGKCNDHVDEGFGFLYSNKNYVMSYRVSCDKLLNLFQELEAKWVCRDLLNVQAKRGYLYTKSKETINTLCGDDPIESTQSQS